MNELWTFENALAYLKSIFYKIEFQKNLQCMPVASPDKGGAFDGRGADTAVCKKNKTTETNHERLQHETIPARTAPG